MKRDVSRALGKLHRAVLAMKRAVASLEDLAQILTDMDARTGTRDPPTRAKAAKRTVKRAVTLRKRAGK